MVNSVSVPDLCLLPYFDLGTFSLINSHWAAFGKPRMTTRAFVIDSAVYRRL